MLLMKQKISIVERILRYLVEEGVVDKTVMDGEEARDHDHPKDSTRSKLLNRTVISASDDIVDKSPSDKLVP